MSIKFNLEITDSSEFIEFLGLFSHFFAIYGRLPCEDSELTPKQVSQLSKNIQERCGEFFREHGKDLLQKEEKEPA